MNHGSWRHQLPSFLVVAIEPEDLERGSIAVRSLPSLYNVFIICEIANLRVVQKN